MYVHTGLARNYNTLKKRALQGADIYINIGLSEGINKIVVLFIDRLIEAAA